MDHIEHAFISIPFLVDIEKEDMIDQTNLRHNLLDDLLTNKVVNNNVMFFVFKKSWNPLK